MTPKETTKLKVIDTLLEGGHSPNSKMCVMEAAAYVSGDKWTAAPECVSPIIANFMVSWNDSLPTDVDRSRLLAPLIPLVLGTRGTSEHEMTRSWLAFDWLVRECGPAFMDLTDALKPHAKAIRALGPIFDKSTLIAARPTIEAAIKASGAARDAAWAAAWLVIGDVVWAVAGGVIGGAVGGVVGGAAWAEFVPTVPALQDSASDLVKRMADVYRQPFDIKRPLQIGEVVIQ